MAERPLLPPAKVTVTRIGRWLYRVDLNTSYFTTASWLRYGLKRAKRKASLELYREIQRNQKPKPDVIYTSGI